MVPPRLYFIKRQYIESTYTLDINCILVLLYVYIDHIVIDFTWSSIHQYIIMICCFATLWLQSFNNTLKWFNHSQPEFNHVVTMQIWIGVWSFVISIQITIRSIWMQNKIVHYVRITSRAAQYILYRARKLTQNHNTEIALLLSPVVTGVSSRNRAFIPL